MLLLRNNSPSNHRVELRTTLCYHHKALWRVFSRKIRIRREKFVGAIGTHSFPN